MVEDSRMTMLKCSVMEMPDDELEKGCLFDDLLEVTEGIFIKGNDRREQVDLLDDKNQISSLTSCV
jgi:hypothetical protein